MATPATGNVEKIISVKFDSQQAVRGIMSLNQQLVQNTKDLKQMADAGKKGTKAYADLEQETKALKSQKRDLSQMVQNEIKQQTTLDGSLRNLRAELSNLTKQYDALSRAERENVNVGGKLKNQINQVTKEIKDAEYGTERYYRNVGNYQNAILGALGINGRFAQSIMGLTSMQGGFSGALAGMGASVKAFGASLMALMSNPVFLALAGIAGVGMAIKWFYDYNEGIAEANRLTREFTGYTGDDLVAMRNSIQATADVMGKDFKETLQTVDALMANFHLTGAEAMDVINKGFAAGADVNGDMLQKVQQLAPAFRNAGIEADQLMALIAQTRSGIFSSQGLDAIVMGTSRIRQMSDTMKKALNDIGIDAQKMAEMLRTGEMSPFGALTAISEQLQTLSPNTQEYGEVMNSVFGKAGKTISTEMIQGLADMSTSLDEVKSKTGEYGDLLLENIKTEEELDNVTSALFDMTNKGWEEVKQQATIFAKKALVEVVKGLVDVTNWFIRLYNKSLIVRLGVQNIIAAFKSLWETVKFVFNLVLNAAQSLGRAFSAIAEIIESAFSFDAKGVVAGMQAMNDAVKKGWDKLVNDAKNLGKGVMTAIGDGVVEAVNGQEIPEIAIPVLTSSVGGKKNSKQNKLLEDNLPSSPTSKGSKRGGTTKATPKTNTTTTPKETPEQKAAREAEEAAQKRMNALIAEGEKLKMQALQERAKNEAKAIDELAEAQKQEIIKKYGTLEELQARLAKATTDAEKAQAQGAIDGYNALMADVDKKRSDAITKMVEEDIKARKEADAKAAADAKTLAQTWFDSTTEGTQAHLKWQLELIRMEKEAELALYENNEQMKQAIIAKYQKQEEDARRNNANAMMEIERTKYEAIGGMVGGLGEIMGAFGEENKEMVALQKTLALAEIMINQAVAISNAIKAGSNAVSPWQMIAQIATSITAVTVAMAQAFKSLNEAKFATGGYVRGAGTGTSDSIPVRVSNGESVMNANTTAMFSGLLSSLNQLGGGVPIQVQQTASSLRGEDMLARAVARGVAMLPAPVVSVEDINRGQRQVEVMNERATL